MITLRAPATFDMEDVIDLCNIFEELDGDSLSENEVNSQDKHTIPSCKPGKA